MKTSSYLWLIPALLLSASNGLFGCSKDPLSLGDDDAQAGTSGSGGVSGGKGGMTGSGGKGGMTSSGAGGAGATASEVCSQAACGPQLGQPNHICEDGSTAGPTGRCLRAANGTCAWEVLECPTATGEAGAPGAGGVSSAGGSPGNGGSSSSSGSGGGGSDACGGCAVTERCIYQVGGPGPSHFTCATQLPCGAPGACACIVDQGVCEMNLSPDGYCHCDNGLE
jgi:hypothetical protein